MKLCSLCQERKNELSFNRDKNSLDGLSFYCKECRKKKRIEYRGTIHKYNIEYYSTNADRERKRAKLGYYENIVKNRSNNFKYYKNRRSIDVEFKLRTNLRNRLNTFLRKNKAGSTIKDLGCSIEQLKVYLEKQFKDDMSWENYGTFGWHIDHIVPLASFDLTDREQFLRACHYTNLQPLWAKDNLEKISNDIKNIKLSKLIPFETRVK